MVFSNVIVEVTISRRSFVFCSEIQYRRKDLEVLARDVRLGRFDCIYTVTIAINASFP